MTNSNSNFQSKVTITYNKALRILQIDNEFKKMEEESLEDARARRDKLKHECQKDSVLKLENLNETLVSKELEMERKYLLFEDKLRNKD